MGGKNVEIVELPSGDGKIVIGLLLSLAAVIVAIAVWQVSAYVGIAVLCLGGGIGIGIGIERTCRGFALLYLYRRRGDAELAEALGRGKAAIIAARRERLTDGRE